MSHAWSRCVRQDYGHLGCTADVIDLADARCSARRKCSIRVPDAALATTKPCPDDLKPYLEADYVCVKGIDADYVCVRSIEGVGAYLLAKEMLAE